MGLGDQMQTVTDRSARASISWRLYYLRTAQRCSTSCSRPHLRAAAAASSSSSHTQQQHVINALLYFFFGQLGVVVVGLRLSRKKSFLSYSPLAPLTFICIYKTPFSFLPFDSFLSLMIITKHTHRTRKEKKKYNHQPSRTGVCLHGNRQAQTMVNPSNNKIGKGKKNK
jgi:hypothetical protein